MKFNKFLFAGLALLLIMGSSCSKDEPIEEAKELEIIYTFIDDNTVQFEHNNVFEGQPSWDFGNGKTSEENTATVAYPLAGTYTVSLSIFTATTVERATTEVVITASDPDLIGLTPDEELLCGGVDALNGKTWVWAKGVPQHMMLAQANPWQWWWGAAPHEKEPFNMYDDKMIFKSVDNEFVLVNNDSTYVNVNWLSDFSVEGDEDETVFFDLEGARFKWKIEDESNETVLSLTNGGFMSYYVGVSKYTVETLTEDELTLIAVIDNVWWQFMFIREGYDHPEAVDPEEPVVNPNASAAVSVDELIDDFETDAAINWLFQAEGGGGSGDDMATNPAKAGLDTSNTVYEYVKGGWEYSNASMELNFTLDLNTHNKVSFLAYFPSTNSYTEAGLKQKASVKLQRWEEAAPWNNQAEVVIEDIPLDEWTELVFDFSTIIIPGDRMTNYFDKILIQFGDEGHTENGTFYLDDFEVLPAE